MKIRKKAQFLVSVGREERGQTPRLVCREEEDCVRKIRKNETKTYCIRH